MRMHSPSATQDASCILVPHGESCCNPLHGCQFGCGALSAHTECSRVHQAAPAEAHLVQGVEDEGVPERQDRPGQGP